MLELRHSLRVRPAVILLSDSLCVIIKKQTWVDLMTITFTNVSSDRDQTSGDQRHHPEGTMSAVLLVLQLTERAAGGCASGEVRFHRVFEIRKVS